MLDYVITGGQVIDGTGRPGQWRDVGIYQGAVVVLEPGHGELARETVHAGGAIVAPGFIDIHTHLDAQLFWDPTCSPSVLHGATTVIGGNCGYSLAPFDTTHGDYLLRLMAAVEGIPSSTLRTSVPWSWSSFRHYLDLVERQPLRPNVGFLVGHSALRVYAMGPEAVAGAASSSQVAAMCQQLEDAIRAGALGLSSSTSPNHHDGDRNHVPSFFAARSELMALARTLCGTDATALELIPTVGEFKDRDVDLMCDLSIAAKLPLNWNVLNVDAERPAVHQNQLAAGDRVRERGGRIVALTTPVPFQVRMNFVDGYPFAGLPGWQQLFTMPVPQRLASLADPGERRRLRAGAEQPGTDPLGFRANWSAMTVVETFSEETAGYHDRTIGSIAAERSQEPFDTLLDIVVQDGLRTGLLSRPLGADDASWRERAAIWRRGDVVIGGSDAGAHLDVICGAIYTTTLLAEAVRARQLITVEEAVHQLTDVPARLYGLSRRGRLFDGWHADLVIFDPETVAPGAVQSRSDLPGGEKRLSAEPVGIESVFVNGERTVVDNRYTDRAGGILLRSGRDTER